MWVSDLKGSLSKNTSSSQSYGLMLLLILQMRARQSRLYIIQSVCSTVHNRSEGQQDYTGVIGALFERMGLKLELVDLCRPQCRLTGLREKAEEEYRLKLTLEACSQ